MNINDFSKNEILVYPIPFTDEILIEGFEGDIKIVDLNGKIIISKHLPRLESINTRNLNSGVYVIQLEQNGKVISKKILKK